jgi:signal transduction histidine kinase
VHPCFTGNAYRIVSLDYDGRAVGRLILGPYAPAAIHEVPRSLSDIDKALDKAKAKSLLAKVPQAKAETVVRIAAHLHAALDLILFSGHKALLTSHMHLLSVRESYRELEEKNAKLQEAYDRLKELDRLKSNFLATVSHELRTPLTSIIGYSEMLTEGIAGELTGEQREFIGTIHEKGEQLLGLIKGLLDLSKLESGTMSMRRRGIRIREVLDEVMSTLAPIARKKGVELRLETDGSETELRADPERLRQVFINLVDNALKFTPEKGGVTLRARTTSSATDRPPSDADPGFALMAPALSRVEVRVIDTGIGIPPREREKVFDPFYQVDSSSTREYGGTGLGLSIVKRLVEAHGGTVTIEENVPRGAVFVVSLPAGSFGSMRPPAPG